MAILKSTIEMAVSKSPMAPVLAIDRSVTRRLRGGAEDEDRRVSSGHPSAGEVEMKPVSSGYADVNGIELYHEIYGEGEPLVLIHGGLTTIGEMQGWVQPLAKIRQVIAVEMQGHGRTADTDRPISFATMGDDIVALLDYLKMPKVDLVGHSFGGASAIRAAIQHPEKVRGLVVISSPYARSGSYPEAQRGMSHVGAAMAENMMQTPTGKFSKQWPDPQRFPQFLDKMGNMMSEDYDWSADIAKLPMAVLLVFADNDSVSQKHIAEFFALLGGGVKEPGWLNTQLSKSRLAVVPGYSHYNFITSAEVPQIIGKFLADPLTNAPAGRAATGEEAVGPDQKPERIGPL
jgi:pimeloyl-ACP methyl ester carboxylesterase